MGAARLGPGEAEKLIFHKKGSRKILPNLKNELERRANRNSPSPG